MKLLALERLTIALLLALIAVLAPLVACGPGSNVEADAAVPPQAESSDEESFFANLFGPDTVEVSVPAGSVLAVRLLDTLSSHDSTTGQDFAATIDEDVSAHGRIAIPAGSVVRGEVTEARPPKSVGGRARLSLDFETLELPNGEEHTIDARFARSGRSETPKDAAIIGGSTLAGAVLGEAVDDDDGGVIGGIVGGLAGTAAAIKTKGKPVVLPSGSLLYIELTSAVTVELPR